MSDIVLGQLAVCNGCVLVSSLELAHQCRIGVTLKYFLSCPDVKRAAHAFFCWELGEDGSAGDGLSFPLAVPKDAFLSILLASHAFGVKAWQPCVPERREQGWERSCLVKPPKHVLVFLLLQGN